MAQVGVVAPKVKAMMCQGYFHDRSDGVRCIHAQDRSDYGLGDMPKKIGLDAHDEITVAPRL